MVRIKTFIDEPQPTAVAAPGKPLEATVFVAARDARAEVKAMADFVCTGTNDQDVIAQAINSLPSSGGKVKLSEGTFVFNGSLNILRSNVTLEGCGASTKIFLANGANTNVIVVGNGSTSLSNIKICNLLIDGNKENQSAISSGIYFYGGVGYSIIENVWVKNCYEVGIYLYYSNDNIITGNICQLNNYCGIFLENSNNNIITRNICQLNNYFGIFILYSNNNTVTGNNCQYNGYDGICLAGGNNNTVTGNNCQYNGYDGICLAGGNNNTVTGNICLSNNETGIWIEFSNNNTITGNVFQSNGLLGICAWYSMYNIIAENQVLSNGGEGIYVFSASERNIIKGNLISSNNGNGIWIDACSLQIISGNFIYGNQGVAILANHSNHLVITGNNILENGKAGTGLISGAADIWIVDSVYCNISNNICYIPVPGPDYGIRESNTSDYNIISGNFVDGYKIKIGLVGLNSKSFGNIEL